MRELSTKELRMLAEGERTMDSGQQPYVMWGNQRMMVNQEVMEELGLEPRQTVSDTLATAIMETQLRNLTAMVARERLH